MSGNLKHSSEMDDVQEFLEGIVSLPEPKKKGRPKGSGKCSLCGETGHNKRKCPSCIGLNKLDKKNSVETTEPKKKGPKPGSKNKKKIPKESVSTTEPKKKGPGRPKGSKNKKDSVETTEPKKRGRPSGIPSPFPYKTKKNMAAATVIQKYVRGCKVNHNTWGHNE